MGCVKSNQGFFSTVEMAEVRKREENEAAEALKCKQEIKRGDRGDFDLSLFVTNRLGINMVLMLLLLHLCW
ncbi:hypothetical protein L2E82_35928 [Cichorium intybus]|uniref:Uncharacterized protein n=1 Tax=Cichorium intybus TaxID=13427 RepID=A0ACB9BQ76_CICIN|nr:hypothetical protein L2E82_35928 [Cichorium intybus]